MYLAGSDSVVSVWDSQLFGSIFLFKMTHLTQLLFDFICCFVDSCIVQLIIHCFSNQSEESVQDTSIQCPEIDMTYAVAMVIGSKISLALTFSLKERSLYKSNLLS